MPNLSVVSVPLRNRMVTGFVLSEVAKPPFSIKPIKVTLSDSLLPYHCLQLAEWIRDYYCSSFGDALRQFAPASTVIRRGVKAVSALNILPKLDLDNKLTTEQKLAVQKIKSHPSTSVLLHGETGSGKTRVYLELAQETVDAGRSVIMLTPEIALTAQLAAVAAKKLSAEVVVLHSELAGAERKKLWFKILESRQPLVIIGPRSALFAPTESLGLIVVDEAHEPAYKQEQSPRYHSVRVASQLGLITGSKVILGSATPNLADYFVAEQKDSIVKMRAQARTGKIFEIEKIVVDQKDKTQFKKNPYLSDQLIGGVQAALGADKQSLIYYNRRGSARIIMCDKCGWQMLCPNCDVTLVYHSDEHLARCHICGYSHKPPIACPGCGNPEIVFKSIGAKALHQIVTKLFPSANVKRFDGDNIAGEKLNETYDQLHSGEVDILVGTQLLAKGLDLPRLGFVGVVSADSSLSLPDFTAEERTYQLLYQVIGRIGRGAATDKAVIQTYDPESLIVKAALSRDWDSFYKASIAERREFRFPPYSYLLKMVCKRATIKGAETAAENLRLALLKLALPIEIIGPTPSFYGRRGKYYYYQLILKSKDRRHLLSACKAAPAGWTLDIDPSNLL